MFQLSQFRVEWRFNCAGCFWVCSRTCISVKIFF